MVSLSQGPLCIFLAKMKLVTTTKGACAHPDVALAAASGPSSTHMLHPTNKKAPMGWLLLLPQVPFPKEGKALCLSDGAVLQLN